MKKIIASCTTLVMMLLAFVSLSILAAPAATAGDSPNVAVCHATGSDKYTSNTISKTAVVKGTGHGGHKDDIIPSFTYAEKKGDPLKTYPGQNWTAEGQAILANSCVKPLKVVAPIAPTYTPGTCINPTGTVNLVDQPEGVVLNFGPTLDGNQNTWKVSYTPAEGFKFATETSGIFAFTVVGPNTSDPNWDAETNGCGLPEVGAGNLTDFLPYALGLFAIGGVLAVIGFRRKNA